MSSELPCVNGYQQFKQYASNNEAGGDEALLEPKMEAEDPDYDTTEYSSKSDLNSLGHVISKLTLGKSVGPVHGFRVMVESDDDDTDYDEPLSAEHQSNQSTTDDTMDIADSVNIKKPVIGEALNEIIEETNSSLEINQQTSSCSTIALLQPVQIKKEIPDETSIELNYTNLEPVKIKDEPLDYIEEHDPNQIDNNPTNSCVETNQLWNISDDRTNQTELTHVSNDTCLPSVIADTLPLVKLENESIQQSIETDPSTDVHEQSRPLTWESIIESIRTDMEDDTGQDGLPLGQPELMIKKPEQLLKSELINTPGKPADNQNAEKVKYSGEIKHKFTKGYSMHEIEYLINSTMRELDKELGDFSDSDDENRTYLVKTITSKVKSKLFKLQLSAKKKLLSEELSEQKKFIKETIKQLVKPKEIQPKVVEPIKSKPPLKSLKKPRNQTRKIQVRKNQSRYKKRPVVIKKKITKKSENVEQQNVENLPDCMKTPVFNGANEPDFQQNCMEEFDEPKENILKALDIEIDEKPLHLNHDKNDEAAIRDNNEDDVSTTSSSSSSSDSSSSSSSDSSSDDDTSSDDFSSSDEDDSCDDTRDVTLNDSHNETCDNTHDEPRDVTIDDPCNDTRVVKPDDTPNVFREDTHDETNDDTHNTCNNIDNNKKSDEDLSLAAVASITENDYVTTTISCVISDSRTLSIEDPSSVILTSNNIAFEESNTILDETETVRSDAAPLDFSQDNKSAQCIIHIDASEIVANANADEIPEDISPAGKDEVPEELNVETENAVQFLLDMDNVNVKEAEAGVPQVPFENPPVEPEPIPPEPPKSTAENGKPRIFRASRKKPVSLTGEGQNKPQVSYPCSFCGKRYRQSHFLMKHELQFCYRRFANKSMLQKKKDFCPTCLMELKSPEEYVNHQKVHEALSSLRFICGVCGKQYIQKAKLRQHLDMAHGNKTHECSICSASFTKKIYLKNHYRMEHPIDDTGVMIKSDSSESILNSQNLKIFCTNCKSPFYIRKNILFSTEVSKCPLCNYVFNMGPINESFYRFRLKARVFKSKSQCYNRNMDTASLSGYEHQSEKQSDKTPLSKKPAMMSDFPKMNKPFIPNDKDGPKPRIKLISVIRDGKKVLILMKDKDRSVMDKEEKQFVPEKCKYCNIIPLNEKLMVLHIKNYHPEKIIANDSNDLNVNFETNESIPQDQQPNANNIGIISDSDLDNNGVNRNPINHINHSGSENQILTEPISSTDIKNMILNGQNNAKELSEMEKIHIDGFGDCVLSTTGFILFGEDGSNKIVSYDYLNYLNKYKQRFIQPSPGQLTGTTLKIKKIKYDCKRCYKWFSQESNLKLHFLLNHQCSHCSQTFDDVQAIERHFNRVHQKNFINESVNNDIIEANEIINLDDENQPEGSNNYSISTVYRRVPRIIRKGQHIAPGQGVALPSSNLVNIESYSAKCSSDLNPRYKDADINYPEHVGHFIDDLNSMQVSSRGRLIKNKIALNFDSDNENALKDEVEFKNVESGKRKRGRPRIYHHQKEKRKGKVGRPRKNRNQIEDDFEINSNFEEFIKSNKNLQPNVVLEHLTMDQINNFSYDNCNLNDNDEESLKKITNCNASSNVNKPVSIIDSSHSNLKKKHRKRKKQDTERNDLENRNLRQRRKRHEYVFNDQLEFDDDENFIITNDDNILLPDAVSSSNDDSDGEWNPTKSNKNRRKKRKINTRIGRRRKEKISDDIENCSTDIVSVDKPISNANDTESGAIPNSFETDDITKVDAVETA